MNRERKNAYERERRAKSEAHRERHREYMRRYRAENPAKVRAWEDASKATHAEKVKQRNRDYYRRNADARKAQSEAWRIANPERVATYRANRRARKVANGGRLSPGLVERLYALQKGKCACCGKPLGKDYNLDHIMPLALGGPNTDDNAQLLLAKCNNLKRAKHPVEFMQTERGMLL